MPEITSIKAREILDSRGNPTVEVDIFSGKIMARASVPSGASTGIHEALELRDKGKKYLGKGVLNAVSNVNKEIAKRVIGMNPLNQEEVDKAMIELDGTPNKAKLGANAILAVSLANARLASLMENMQLYKYIAKTAKTKTKMPVPFFNVINGGKHADTNLKVQELMLVPKANTFKESLRIGSETYHILKEVIEKKFGKNSTNVGDEGGFVPNISSTQQALDILNEAIKKSGAESKIGIDCAASSFFSGNQYIIDGKAITKKQLLEMYTELAKKYPIISIEDPFQEDDFESFAELTKTIGKKVQIVADDLTATNTERIKKAAEKKSCNCLLLKVNQIGTLTEAISAFKTAQKNNWNVMVSHRSGETEDTFIADLAVGLGAGQIKAGAPCRTERTAKYNQLLRIEEEL